MIRTEETGLLLGIVSERRCVVAAGEGAKGKEFMDRDGDPAVPLDCSRGRLSLRKVEGTGSTAAFSGGVGGETGEVGVSGRGRESGFGFGLAVWVSH